MCRLCHSRRMADCKSGKNRSGQRFLEKRMVAGLKRNRNVIKVAMAFVAVCILIGILCLMYYFKLQDTVKTESQGYMQEISRQMGANINKNIDDNYAMLGTMAAVLQELEVDSYERLREIVDEQRDLWHYQDILLIDESGAAYGDDGSTVALSSDPYIQDVVVRRISSLSTSQVIGGKECVIFAIPIEGIKLGSTEMCALAVSYDLSTFDKMLAMTAFDGRGYAHIIGGDGSAVVRSSSQNALETGYNILNSLSQAKIYSDKDLSRIKSDIANGISGQAEFKLDGAHQYMTYIPLGKADWSLLSFVPVEVVNAKSNMLLKITLMMCAMITLTFAALLAVIGYSFYRHKRKLEQIAYVDDVTGGHTIDRFYELAQGLLSGADGEEYALVYSNIEKFKVLNEQFGREACDCILRSIERGIGLDLEPDECMGRLTADHFCILMKCPKDGTLSHRFMKWHKNSLEYATEHCAVSLPLIVEFGVFVIDNVAMPLAQMTDRAKISLNEAAGELHGKIRYAIYDENVRKLLFREKQLEDWMQEALAAHEFQVYLQPKYITRTEQIGGAEALVRWRHPQEGMIFPDEFIPLFEKNGFVTQLDFYMFEQVCVTMRGWLDQGITPVKISVNCSRQHLKNPNFLKKYSSIADQYEIPHDLLEIELTENTVFGDVESLSDIIRNIRSDGFGCSMDDFGSGYSSLNLIQDIPVDTLKLDRIFFRNLTDLQRSESVVGSIITMAKALSMQTVAEGVEERVQVDMLKRLSCDFIQGFYFAKPMPIAEFEKLAFSPASKDGKENL